MTKGPIPASGKIHEFDITLVNDVDECDDALSWVAEQVTNMEGQVSYRRARGIADPIWLSRINLALKRAKELRRDVEHLRGRLRRHETLQRQREVERVFMDAALQVLPADQTRKIWTEMEKRIGSASPTASAADRSSPPASGR